MLYLHVFVDIGFGDSIAFGLSRGIAFRSSDNVCVWVSGERCWSGKDSLFPYRYALPGICFF